MNIFVCVKQVPDTETKIIPNSDSTYIDISSVQWVMNPYDEYAVEQAVQIKEKIKDATVILVRVGSVHGTKEALRTGMAMGADESILVETPDNLDSYATAKAIKGAIEKSGKSCDMIITGKQAIDDDCMQVPQILAELMDLPSVTVVFEYDQDGNTLKLKREVEGGAVEVYSVDNPAIVACSKGINTPRFASLPGIMKAKKKPLTKLSLSDVSVSENDQKIEYTKIELPKEKASGKKFDALDESKIQEVCVEVTNLLRNEAKAI